MQRSSHRWWLALGLAAGLVAGRPAAAGASAAGEIAFHRGVVAFAAGQLDQARREFEAALAEDPESRDALRYLARIVEAQGDPATALRLVERARSLDPGDGELASDRAALLIGVGRGEEARGELAKVLDLDPGDARARRLATLARRSASFGPALDPDPPPLARRASRSPLGDPAAAFAAAWSLEAEVSPLELQTDPGWLDGAVPLHPLQSGPLAGAGLSRTLPRDAWATGPSPAVPGTAQLAGLEDLAHPAGLGRGGERRRLALAQSFALPQPFRYVTLGAGADVLDSVGPALRWDGYETSLGAGHELPYALSFSWLWRFAHRDFRGASAFEPFARRVDDTHQLTAELARPLVDHWIARITGSLRIQDSSVSAYDEERKSVGASLTYEW